MAFTTHGTRINTGDCCTGAKMEVPCKPNLINAVLVDLNSVAALAGQMDVNATNRELRVTRT
jgi:hypothetical protein